MPDDRVPSRRPSAGAPGPRWLAFRCVAVSLGLATGVMTLGVPAQAAPPAGTATLPFPRVDLAVSPAQSRSVTVPVPAGTTPSTVTVRLADPAGVAVVARVQVGGRTALTTTLQPHVERQVAVPVRASDVTRGVLALTFGVHPSGRAGNACGATLTGTPELGVSRLAVFASGTDGFPATVSTFFPALASRLVVEVPAKASPDALAAGLSAVAALAARYGSGSVELATSAPAGRVIGERVVRIEPSSTAMLAVEPEMSVPTLEVGGHGAALQRLASALDSPALAQLNSSFVSGPALGPVTVAAPDSLAGLGARRIALAGFGTVSAAVEIRQGDFGRPVSGLRLRLIGTHSALPAGTAGTLHVSWNGVPVASRRLAGGTVVDLPVTVPPALMRGTDQLRLTTDVAVPVSCGAATTPFRVEIDGARSTVTATAGDGVVTGFQRFPQVLRGTLPVALGGQGLAKVRNAALAAGLVAALQRGTSAPLRVELVTPHDLLGGSGSGLLVGATGAETDQVAAGLRLYGIRPKNVASRRAAVGTDQPYAALQEVRQHGRDLLILGWWAPPGTARPVGLARRAVASVAASGWFALSDDLLLSTGTLAPFALSSSAVRSQSAATSSHHGPWPWVSLAILVALLLAALAFRRTQRPQRPQRTRHPRVP